MSVNQWSWVRRWPAGQLTSQQQQQQKMTRWWFRCKWRTQSIHWCVTTSVTAGITLLLLLLLLQSMNDERAELYNMTETCKVNCNARASLLATKPSLATDRPSISLSDLALSTCRQCSAFLHSLYNTAHYMFWCTIIICDNSYYRRRIIYVIQQRSNEHVTVHIPSVRIQQYCIYTTDLTAYMSFVVVHNDCLPAAI